MAEISALYSQRTIVARHEQAGLYHPFVEALAFTLVDLPITFIITVIFCVVLYFMVRLQQSAAQFLYGLIFLLGQSFDGSCQPAFLPSSYS